MNLETEIQQLAPGETIHVDHEQCGDTRGRLYITRHASNPIVLFYCHNCTKGWVEDSNKQQNYRVDAPKIAKEASKEAIAPRNLVADPTDWPTQARQWAYRTQCQTDTLIKHGIKYHPNSNCMYLPVWNTVFRTGCTRLVGYQLRRLGEWGPKYTSNKPNKTDVFFTHFEQNTLDPSLIVIVEDIISGLRIWEAVRQQDIEIFVNYGVGLKVEQYANLSKNKFLVWLDNDNAIVDEQARKMEGVLKLIHGTPVERVLGYEEAKHYGDVKILEIIEEYEPCG